ncbi:MAG: glutamine--fructose-6-phosphate transaminase (isomerizing), partial [Sinobacteraceae bacterium]|nr:glutamine--fructose-6-phosphate transaminase (isomerizing) [Nevskiaceae bacterium]
AHHLMRLEDGDIVELDADGVRIVDSDDEPVERPRVPADCPADAAEKQGYRHFMLKEIYEQGPALRATLAEGQRAFGDAQNATLGALLEKVEHVHLVACGTSYHAALVACYLIEALAGVPCIAERASEYRYRQPVTRRNSLFVVLSQSGETADTLAALRLANGAGYLATLAICNQPASSMVQEAQLDLITRAGPEIGVASTKAFTTQVMTIAQLAIALASRGQAAEHAADKHSAYGLELGRACVLVDLALELEPTIKVLAEQFTDCQNVLFLGRGTLYPIAMEGALKLKEISYIHAQAHAAGELKHGPLALVDEQVPVIALAPTGPLLPKIKANIEEVRARKGRVFVFTDSDSGIAEQDGCSVIPMPTTSTLSAPLVYTVPLQLLAYHVADLRGNNVDKPRNLAKSVTVE